MTINADFVRLFKREPWMDEAICRGINPDVFYPTPRGDAIRALALCAGCPVRRQCSDAAQPDDEGIWGGRRVDLHNLRNHGTVATYNRGCDCTPCAEAKRAANAARDRKKVA